MSETRNEQGRNRLTVIVVPDETSPVRRFQVPRGFFRNLIIIAVLLAAGLLALLADYTRLRFEAVDVERMRAETAIHRQELASLSTHIGTLDQDLSRIQEFERKVRVMANLPAAMSEVDAPDALDGQGGDAAETTATPDRNRKPGEDDASVGPAGGAGGAEAPEVEIDLEEEAGGADLGSDAGLDVSAIARIQSKAQRLRIRVETQSGSLQALIQGLEGQTERLAATPSIWPTDGWVTSGYGYRKSPFTGSRKFHGGIDIAANFGTSIIAPARGKVVFVGRKGPLGKTVSIDHGYGIQTQYGHVAEIYVKKWQEVERGQRIAAVGSTGRSTGPHLHYGVQIQGKTVNPADYILE